MPGVEEGVLTGFRLILGGFDLYLGCENKIEGPDEVSDGSCWKTANDRVVPNTGQNPAHRPEHNWSEDNVSLYERAAPPPIGYLPRVIVRTNCWTIPAGERRLLKMLPRSIPRPDRSIVRSRGEDAG